jgi:hypothetical protein
MLTRPEWRAGALQRVNRRKVTDVANRIRVGETSSRDQDLGQRLTKRTTTAISDTVDEERIEVSKASRSLTATTGSRCPGSVVH